MNVPKIPSNNIPHLSRGDSYDTYRPNMVSSSNISTYSPNTVSKRSDDESSRTNDSTISRNKINESRLHQLNNQTPNNTLLPNSIPFDHPDSTDETDNSHRRTFLQHFITNWLITDPNLIQRPVRNYQAESRDDMKYIYFFGGRWRTIKAFPLNVFTLALVIAPGVLYIVFSLTKANHILGGFFIYSWILTIYNLIRASVSDPGILPYNVHLSVDSKNLPAEYHNRVLLPYDNERGVAVKYCTTCRIWRPPRAAHCSVCNVCCASHDHHCVFLNNCVGYRNHSNFLWFLFFAVASLSMFLAGVITLRDVRKHPVSIFLVVYGSLAMVYPLLLLVVHIFLTSQNITTREYLNHVYSAEFPNVYKRLILKNLYVNWIGKQRGLTLVKARGTYEDGDLRMQSFILTD